MGAIIVYFTLYSVETVYQYPKLDPRIFHSFPVLAATEIYQSAGSKDHCAIAFEAITVGLAA